jgi:dodecin
MAQIAKIIELVGTSQTGFQDAVEVAVREAARTIRGISGVEITNMTAEVQGDRITSWRANVKIAFSVEDEPGR